MSESIPVDPKTGMPLIGAADYADAQKKALLDVMSMPNAALSVAPTVLNRDPQATEGRQYIPAAGAGEMLAGMGHYLGSSLATLGNAAGRALFNPPDAPPDAKKWTDIPQPPQWMADAGRRFEENRADWKTSLENWSGGVLRQPDMTTPSGQVADIIGSSVGMGVGATPEMLVSSLPRALQIPASMALMTRGHAATNVPINLGLATAQEGAAEAFHPDQTPDAMGPAKTDQVTQTATPPALNTAAKVATTPPPAAPSADPFLQYAQPQQKQGGGDLNIKLPFDRDPFLAAAGPGPTFTQEGNVEPTAVGKALGVGSTGEALVALGLTALMIAAGGHAYRRGGAVSSAARDTRLNDPTYAAQVNDYHNDVIKRGPGTGALGNEVPPPPVPQGRINKAITYVADKLGNDAAQNQRAIELMADNPSTAQRMSSTLGNLHDAGLQGNQTRYFVESGHDVETGVHIPSLTNLADKVAALDPAKREMWNLGMAGASEEQVRNNNIAKWQASGGTGTPQLTDIRHMFAGKDMADLQGWVADMRADPVLAALEEQYRSIFRGLHEDIGANPIYGFHTPAAAAELVRLHSNMVPPFDMEGRPLHPMEMTRQNTFTGQAAGGVDPLHALTVHVEQMWNEFKRNKFNQDFVKLREDYQRVPGTPQTMQDVHAPTGPHTSYMSAGGVGNPKGTPGDPIITLRTPTGLRYIKEEDPHFYRILSGDSLGMKRVYLGTFDTARQVYQKGTTGMVSVFTGRAQPLRSAVFTPPVMAYTSGAGRAGGMLDWATQRYLPGSVAKYVSPVARGFDMPLNIAALPGFSAYSAAERLAGRFAETFHPNANNIANRKLRALTSDASVDAAHQFASNWWDKSLEKMKLEQGVSGHASPLHVEAPGIRVGTKASILGDMPAGLRLETARVAPRAYINSSLPGVRSFGIKVHNILGQAFNDFGEAGHDMWMRLNRGNPNIDPQTLTYETRNIVGNMARSGSSKILKGASQLLPYTNVSVQGTGATIRAFGARPVATPVTMAVGLGSMALLSILTMMRSGAHLDFLQNLLSTQQRAANLVLGLNDDPLKSTEIPLAQEIRAPFAFALDTTAKMINIIAGRHDPNVAQAISDGIMHFFGSNITSTAVDAMRHGAIDVADFANLPSFMGRIDWNRVIQNQGLSGAYHSPGGTTSRGAPGGQGYDTALDSQNGQIFEEVLSSVFGAIAHSLIDATRSTMRYQTQGHGFLESLGMAGRDWLQTSRESNLMLNNMAWETQVRLSIVPPIAEALQPSLNALKNLPKAVSPGMEGYVGRGPNALPVPMTEDKSVANDMLIRQMLMITRQYDSRINQAMVPINNLKTQMKSVEIVGMDPAKRRAWLNDRTRDIADKWKLVQGYVADLDNSLSNMAGKPLRVQDINWKQNSSQFR